MKWQDINDIMKEPAHGAKFYNLQTALELIKKLAEIYYSLDIGKEDTETKIQRISDYVKENVNLRSSYFDAVCDRAGSFDRNELEYRTAYGALIKGEAMCAGYTEAVRMMLSLYEIKNYTLLSKLPGANKKLVHYVAVAEYKDKNEQTRYTVIDPEREANCEKKGIPFKNYKESLIYTIPDPIFTTDVVGKNGLGIEVEEYLRHEEIPRVVGTENVGSLIKEINERKKSKNEIKNQVRQNTEQEL